MQLLIRVESGEPKDYFPEAENKKLLLDNDEDQWWVDIELEELCRRFSRFRICRVWVSRMICCYVISGIDVSPEL